MDDDPERELFKAALQRMPEWAPEFEHHRPWVEAFAWFIWRDARALPHPDAERVAELEREVARKSDAIQKLWRERDSALARIAALEASLEEAISAGVSWCKERDAAAAAREEAYAERDALLTALADMTEDRDSWIEQHSSAVKDAVRFGDERNQALDQCATLHAQLAEARGRYEWIRENGDTDILCIVSHGTETFFSEYDAAVDAARTKAERAES